jgi:hypothetical protein
VGHIARLLEEAGLATVVIATGLFRDRLAALRVPRTVLTRHPLGRPLGAPDDRETQRRVLLAGLDLLQTARGAGAIVELPQPYRPPPPAGAPR